MGAFVCHSITLGFSARNCVNQCSECRDFENSEKKSADANVGIDVAAGGYPRVMSCSNDLEHWVEREVLCKKGEGYLAQHVEGFEDGRLVLSFRYAKEVEPEPKIIELTIDEIAERFGVSADQIVIKK